MEVEVKELLRTLLAVELEENHNYKKNAAPKTVQPRPSQPVCVLHSSASKINTLPHTVHANRHAETRLQVTSLHGRGAAGRSPEIPFKVTRAEDGMREN